MYYVYVIENSNNELYFGRTNDLKRRLSEHNSGATFTTAKGTDWQLIYYEAYRTEASAKRREKRIKDYGQAWSQLKKRIAESRRQES